MLGETDVHVWRLSLEQRGATVQGLYQLLSPDEQARADRFHCEDDRRHSIVARACLRMVLGDYLRSDPAGIKFTYSDCGKPRLTGSQGYLKFNLTHSGGLALFAITLVGELGIDIEHLRTDFASDDIANVFFSDTELICLNKLPTHLRNEAFYNCWTRKEAFLKAKGAGLSLPLNNFDVTLAPAEPAALIRTAWDESEAERWSLSELEPGPGYVAAVAVESNHWQLICWQFDERAFRPFV